MTNARRTLLCLIVLLWPACSSGEHVQLLATEAVGPKNSDIESFTLADNEAALASAWNAFRLQGSLPTIDFEDARVVLVAVRESSNCRLVKPQARLVGGHTLDIQVKTEVSGEVCKSNSTPRAFVFRVPAEATSPNLAVTFEERNLERSTSLP